MLDKQTLESWDIYNSLVSTPAVDINIVSSGVGYFHSFIEDSVLLATKCRFSSVNAIVKNPGPVVLYDSGTARARSTKDASTHTLRQISIFILYVKGLFLPGQWMLDGYFGGFVSNNLSSRVRIDMGAA